MASFVGDYETIGFGVDSPEGKFKALKIVRHGPGPHDVVFDLIYCGVCHSDVHQKLDHFNSTQYPIVPGHELAGRVVAVGANVKKFKVGDQVAVGCFVDSCLDCNECEHFEENYCEKGMTGTYNSKRLGYGRAGPVRNGVSNTYGGYSAKHTVHERFCYKVPSTYPLEKAGPLVCAAITMFDPLQHWGAIKGGMTVGIIGCGGLGMMGLKLASAMNNKVVAISTSP